MAESLVQVTEGSGKKLHTNSRTIGANTVEDEYVLIGEPFLATYRVTAAAGGISTATAASHLLEIMAGASLNLFVRRLEIVQLTPVTTAAIDEMQIFRLTTAGTGGTALTPRSMNTADAASGATAMTLPTVKGTEGALLDSDALYFTQTVATAGASSPGRCVWVFDGNRAKPLVILAGTTNGICIKNVTARAAGTVLVRAEFTEANFT